MDSLFIWLGIYIVFLLGLTIWSGRKNNAEDFLVAGRNRKTLQILISKYAATVGIGWFIIYTGYAYQFGWSVLSYLPGLIASYLLFALWAVPRVCKEAQGRKFYTQGDYVNARTNNNHSRVVIDLASVAISVLTVLIALIGGAKVIESIGMFSYEWSLLTTSFVILVYMSFSGFQGVLITDLVQGFIILFFTSIIAWSAIAESGSLNDVLTFKSNFISISELIGFALFGIFSLFAYSDRYQLCFAAKDTKTAKLGMLSSFIPIAITFVLLIFVGLSVAIKQTGLDPDLVFLHFIIDVLPATLLPLITVLLFAGLMSTADTFLYITGLYSALLIPKWNSVNKVRWVMIAAVIILTIIALIARDILDVAILAGAFTLTTPIAMIYVIAGGKKSGKFIASVVGGFLGIAIGITILGLNPAAAPFPLLGGLLGLLWPERLSKLT